MDIRFGAYRVLRRERRLVGPAGPVDVGARSFDILVTLLENAGSVVSKDALMEAAWPGLTVEENTLQVHVSALRRLVGSTVVRTVHGRGYAYAGPEPTGAAPVRPPDADRPGQPAGDEATLPLPDRPSVAVLPFADLSGDHGQAYFCNGITEDIVAGLTRFRGLFVIAARSSELAADPESGPRRIGQRLGVAHVVEGSVRRAGRRLRVGARLLEAASGRLIWAETYDRELEEIFAVEDEITGLIVAALAGRIEEAGRDRAARKPVTDMAGYDHLLRGRHWLKHKTPEGVREARRCFERGLEVDPDSATLCACLADSYMIKYESDWTDARPAALDSALRFAERAVAQDPADSTAWHALAWARMGRQQHDLAMVAIERAIAANPNAYDNLCVKGWCLALSGETGDGIACLDRAIRINPFGSVDCLVGKGIAEYTAHRYEAAIGTFGRVTGVALLRHVLIACCHAQLGREAEARAAMAVAVDLARSVPAAGTGAPVAALQAYLSALCPFRDRGSFEHLLEGLRKAGLDP
jgi:TolB-like protein